jgi:two-component system sensor histidine kinase QseC
MYSIRKKLGYSIIISMIGLLITMATLLFLRVSGHIEVVFDHSLYDKAQALITLTELDEEGLEFDVAEKDVMAEFVTGEDLQYYQVWDNRERELFRSPSLRDQQLPRIGIPVGQHRFADLQLPDGRDGRMIEITFMPRVEIDEEEYPEGEHWEVPRAEPIMLVVARERESLNSTLATVANSILLINILVVLITVLLVWKLIDRGLSPLFSLARQVGAIDEQSLDARLSNAGEDSQEIAPVVHQLNYLLQRLQSAFEREKRFSSNVAHELRTPLSELKTLAEVSRMVPDDHEQLSRFFKDVGEISAQMEKVVLTLLQLARSEAGLLNNDPEDILLHDYCEFIWKQALNGSAADKTLINNVPVDLLVHSDSDKLGIILTNLFVNAACYSPRQAEVIVRTVEPNGRLALQVQNATSDLRPEDIIHMKDRFWRKNKAQDTGTHSGLGLTLVEALARVIQVDIILDLNERGEFCVNVAGLPVTTD